MSELTGKVAVVTGGGRGIGQATALALAQGDRADDIGDKSLSGSTVRSSANNIHRPTS
jgi:NAD(P)-dependent dehydrogenase (short-subunit alcohol dehydrogenase family)